VEAYYLGGAASPGQFPPQGLPEIAFLGRSNVGKSSLINRLLDAKGLAFTSSKPGCTKLIHFYKVEEKMLFVDLPGYGYARVSKVILQSWKRLIESYLEERSSLTLLVLLLDARRGWMEKDLELKQWLEFHNRRHLVVATKVDKLNQSERNRGLVEIRKRCPDVPPVPFSAVTGQGVREIWQAITKTQIRP
jgi:GTP-binding protein